ncbi:MAG TPA: hypothetical protein VMW70_15735 [Burkholderiales bacterium]|nr:hypothetical protein [Burkholderiales bacterium]
MKRFFMDGPWLKLSGSSRLGIEILPEEAVDVVPEVGEAHHFRNGCAQRCNACSVYDRSARDGAKGAVYLNLLASRAVRQALLVR